MNPIRLRTLLAFGALPALAPWSAIATAGPRVEVTVEVEDDGEVGIDFFHHELAAHGHWFETHDHGLVWAPHHMPRDWQPYTLGHWEYTDDYGWLWVSDLEWGWAAFHYGRWIFDDFHGWAWVPDTEWGPAWVAWREGEGYVGWAPLPPQVGWEVGVGLGTSGFDVNVHIHPRHWSFVPERFILEAHLQKYGVEPVRKITLLRRTSDRTRYVSVDGRVVNRGLSVEHVQKVVGRPVTRRTVRVLQGQDTSRRVNVKGGEITMYRPRVVRRTKVTSPGKTVIQTRQVSHDGHTTRKTVVGPAKQMHEKSNTTVRQSKSPGMSSNRKVTGQSANEPSPTQTRKVVRPSGSGSSQAKEKGAGSRSTKKRKKP